MCNVLDFARFCFKSISELNVGNYSLLYTATDYDYSQRRLAQLDYQSITPPTTQTFSSDFDSFYDPAG